MAHGSKLGCCGVWTRPARHIDRLLHGAQQRGVRRANAGSATLSAYVLITEHSFRAIASSNDNLLKLKQSSWTLNVVLKLQEMLQMSYCCYMLSSVQAQLQAVMPER